MNTWMLWESGLFGDRVEVPHPSFACASLSCGCCEFYPFIINQWHSKWNVSLSSMSCSSKLIRPMNAATKSCPTLCDPTEGSPPDSLVPGILQTRTLEWVAISFSNAWKWKVKVKSLSCVRLSDPMDRSLPGSSVHGMFQAEVVEWGAIAFSGPRNEAIDICSLYPVGQKHRWHPGFMIVFEVGMGSPMGLSL